MPTIELNTDYQTAHRFPAWMALGIFSTICIAAVNSRIEPDERDGNSKWVLACTILSMLTGFAGFSGYLFARSMFVGQAPEMILTVGGIALWAAGLPVIMDPENGIAVKNITVLNANLYFFSWLSLAAVVFISGSLAQEQMGMKLRETPREAVSWYCLSASSLVVLGTAVRIFLAVPCRGHSIQAIENGPFCKRTRLAISLGVLTSMLGAAMLYLTTKKMLSTVQETAVTAFLLIFWCFGVGYTTFGESPGSQIGNLYFSSWICFIISVGIFGDTFRKFVSARMQGECGGMPNTAPAPTFDSDGGSLETGSFDKDNIPADLNLDEDTI